MKIICDCGEVTELIDGEFGPTYTDGEGWYKVEQGTIEFNSGHDTVFMNCSKCGMEVWLFA